MTRRALHQCMLAHVDKATAVDFAVLPRHLRPWFRMRIVVRLLEAAGLSATGESLVTWYPH